MTYETLWQDFRGGANRNLFYLCNRRNLRLNPLRFLG